MPLTPLLGIEYPAELEDPFWDTISTKTFVGFDSWIQANAEDKSAVLVGEITFDLPTNKLTWTSPVYIANPRQDGIITIAPGNITIADGQFAYVTVSQRPYQAETLTVSVGPPPLTGINIIPIAFRKGNDVQIKGQTGGSSTYSNIDFSLPAPGYKDMRLEWDTANNCPTFYNDITDVKHQIGREAWVRSYNNSGIDISNGDVVYISGSIEISGEWVPTIAKAKADDYAKSGVLGVATTDIDDGAQGEVTEFGKVNDINTISFNNGDILYLSTTLGELTNTRPIFPAKPIIIGNCLESHATTGSIQVIIKNDQYDYEFDGTAIERQDTFVIEDSGTVYAEVELDGGGDLPVQLLGQVYLIDCTGGAGVGGRARVALTAGTDSELQFNFVYAEIVGGVATLKSSVTAPVSNYAFLSFVSIWSAAKTATDGAALHQRSTDAKEHNGVGRIAHIDAKLRQLGTSWSTGVTPTATITTQGGAVDDLKIETTMGLVWQLHPQIFPVKDTSVGGVYVANASGLGTLTKYQKITNLNECLEDVAGNSLSGTRFNLTLWGAINKTSGECKLYINLPSGEYSSDDDAYYDVGQTAITSVERAVFSTAFLIARIPIRHRTLNNGTLSFINPAGLSEIIPLLGTVLGGSASGGAGSGGGASTLNQLTDVEITAPTSGEILEYNGLIWENVAGVNATSLQTVPIPVPAVDELANDTHNVLKYFQNLIEYPEDLTQVEWTKTGVAISGTTGIVASGSTTTQRIASVISSMEIGELYTIRLRVEGGNLDWMSIYPPYNVASSLCYFDITNSTIGTTPTTENQKIVTHEGTIQDLFVEFTADAISSILYARVTDGDNVTNGTGDGLAISANILETQIYKGTIEQWGQFPYRNNGAIAELGTQEYILETDGIAGIEVLKPLPHKSDINGKVGAFKYLQNFVEASEKINDLSAWEQRNSVVSDPNDFVADSSTSFHDANQEFTVNDGTQSQKIIWDVTDGNAPFYVFQVISATEGALTCWFNVSTGAFTNVNPLFNVQANRTGSTWTIDIDVTPTDNVMTVNIFPADASGSSSFTGGDGVIVSFTMNSLQVHEGVLSKNLPYIKTTDTPQTGKQIYEIIEPIPVDATKIHGYVVPVPPTTGLPVSLSMIESMNHVVQSGALDTAPWSHFRDVWDDAITEISPFTGEVYRGLAKVNGQTAYLSMTQTNVAIPASSPEYWTIAVKIAPTATHKYLKFEISGSSPIVVNIETGVVTLNASGREVNYDFENEIVTIINPSSGGNPTMIIYLASDASGDHLGLGTGVNDMLIGGVQASTVANQPYVETTTVAITDGAAVMVWA